MIRLHLCSQLATKMLLITTVALGFAACTKDLYDLSANGGNPSDEDNPFKIGEVTLADYNDYATSRTVQLNIDYGVECAKAYFEIYAENPFEVKENQVLKRKNLSYIASGFTDKNGVYNKKASITSSVEKVYVFSPDFGVPTLYVADIVNNTLSATITLENAMDLSSMVNHQSTSGTRASQSTITKNIPHILGEWKNTGEPKYLDSSKKIKVSNTLKNYIATFFPEGGENADKYVIDNII